MHTGLHPHTASSEVVGRHVGTIPGAFCYIRDCEPHRNNNPEPGARSKIVVYVYIEGLRGRALCSPVLDVYSSNLHGRDLHTVTAVS